MRISQLFKIKGVRKEMNKKILLLGVIFLFFSSCDMLRKFHSIDGKVQICMTHSEVRNILGSPYDVNKSTSSKGIKENWVYYSLGKWLSIDFDENGHVTDILHSQ